MAAVKGGRDLLLAGCGRAGERAIHAVVVREFEQVLQLGEHLVFAVTRVGDLRCSRGTAFEIETVDDRRRTAGARRRDLAHREAPGVGAVLLLEPWRADPGQCREIGDAIDAVEVELAGVGAERRAGHRGIGNRLTQQVGGDAGGGKRRPHRGVALRRLIERAERRQRGRRPGHVVVDELAQKGVAGGLRAIGTLVVVDKRAGAGAERRPDDRPQGRGILDRVAQMVGRMGFAGRRFAAAGHGAIGPAALIAEAVDRRVGHRGSAAW